ncbi:MAG: amidohydrolase family protein [Xanthomonadales bacterium]|nr:amidohydrolase family protein [Gammaproteobacteria bacterium]MBT8054599.1 amidohydrolase family protein [Gammaproteobacteria bacterium]NND58101.1 amidohydrolase family protein [Xanthomonadales bacterium]NNK50374.1 amidohydrolase family protein [Xanthomonadales bacterium]
MAAFRLFDAHFHVIDPRFPLVPNQGFIPERYTLNDYRDQMAAYDLRGGAIISASFQAFDQDYLVDALARLGPGFVGVTQLPVTVSDEELIELNDAGVRGVRFNLKRGGSEDVKHLDTMARRIHETVGWHVELYVDAREIGDLVPTLIALPAVSIDHLGLSAEGLPTLLQLAEKGIRVKASGFGRVNFDVEEALKSLHAANPACLMFGTDLPSARAKRPYTYRDFNRVLDTLGEKAAERVLYTNALEFYRTH